MSWKHYREQMQPVGEDEVCHHNEDPGDQWYYYHQYHQTKHYRKATWGNKNKPQDTRNHSPWVMEDASRKEGEAASSDSTDWQNVSIQEVQQQIDERA